tara:strand:+ start:2033 stop:2449 length:417 start_codon:yes stop_codon:yes gene_type:complete
MTDKTATLDELRAMRASGAIKPTRDDAPEVGTPEGFWDDAPQTLILQPCRVSGWEFPDSVPYLGTPTTEYTRSDVAQARIAELDATVKGYLGAITDSAGGAPNMQRPAQIALLKLQAVIDWPTKGNGDAIRAALGGGA